MDALDILEAMAANASFDAGTADDSAIERWQQLFGYAAEEARAKIEEQRDDLTAIVSEALWDAVSKQQVALGHDRATYSHWLRLPRHLSRQPSLVTLSNSSSQSSIIGNCRAKISQEQEYLLRLEGPISSSARVAEIAGLASTPEIFEGTSATDAAIPAKFCKIDGGAKQSVLSWLEKYHPRFRPLFVLRSLARKNFDCWSISPFLGQDATLPHRRLPAPDAIVRPAQGEYPVWYFFYGTLANQRTLHTLLQHLDGEDYDISNYNLRPARVTGGELTTWAKTFKGLIDGKEEDEVAGSAFLVRSELHEESLRSYETSAYQVVRCRIECDDGEILHGCTFRLARGHEV